MEATPSEKPFAYWLLNVAGWGVMALGVLASIALFNAESSKYSYEQSYAGVWMVLAQSAVAGAILLGLASIVGDVRTMRERGKPAVRSLATRVRDSVDSEGVEKALATHRFKNGLCLNCRTSTKYVKDTGLICPAQENVPASPEESSSASHPGRFA